MQRQRKINLVEVVQAKLCISAHIPAQNTAAVEVVLRTLGGCLFMRKRSRGKPVDLIPQLFFAAEV